MNIETIDILFLPMLFFIGAVTSHEDIKYGRISNKWIFLGLIYSLGLFSFLLYHTLLDNAIDWLHFPFHLASGYVLKVFMNSLITLVAVFALYRSALMAAGDAKLLFVFSLLLPLKYYWKSYLPVFPSMALLINIFLPIFIFLVLQALVSAGKFLVRLHPKGKKSKSDGKTILPRILKQLVKIMKLFVGMVVVFMLMSKFRPIFILILPIEGFNTAFIFLIMMLVYRRFASLLDDRKIFFGILAGLLVYVAVGAYYLPDNPLDMIWQQAKRAMLFLLIINVLGGLLSYHIRKTAVREIAIDKLMPGMRLATDKIRSILVERNVGGGLTKSEVERAKIIARDRGINIIAVYRVQSFAIWISVGVLITIVLHGSILSAIWRIVL